MPHDDVIDCFTWFKRFTAVYIAYQRIIYSTREDYEIKENNKKRKEKISSSVVAEIEKSPKKQENRIKILGWLIGDQIVQGD